MALVTASPVLAQKADDGGGKADVSPKEDVPAAEPAPPAEDPADAPEQPTQPTEFNKRELFKKTLQSTVLILVGRNGDKGVSLGTGFIIDADEKLVMTNHHVVDGNMEDVEIVLPEYRNGKLITDVDHYVGDEHALPARVIDSRTDVDLAVLHVPRLPEDAVPLKMAEASCEPGEEVHSIGGNPGGGQGLWIYTLGTVRQVYKVELWVDAGFKLDCEVVETQSPINRGDSGGPVVNTRGELIGVNDSHSSDENLRSFAIDITEVKKYLESVRPFLHPSTADEYAARGKNYSEKGRYKLAIKDYNEAIELEDGRAELYVARGDAQRFNGTYDGAIENYAEALRLDPKQAAALMGRGYCFKWKEQYETAIRDFDEALVLDNTLIAAYKGRGETYMAMNKPDQAVASYTDAIRQAPNDKNLYNSRGNAYLAMNDNQKAFTDYTESIRLSNGKDAIPYYNRGLALTNDKQLNEAINDYTKAIELYDKDPDFFMKRGLLFHELKDLDKALEDINHALSLSENFSPLYVATLFVYRGNIFRSANLTDRAQEDYNRAKQLDERALAKSTPLKHFDRRYFKVVNKTGEDLTIWVYYYTKATDGSWLWYPAASAQRIGDPAEWSVAAGRSGQLVHDGFDIKCSAVRIWATGNSSGKTWNEYKDKALPTVPDAGYDAEDWESFTFTFE